MALPWREELSGTRGGPILSQNNATCKQKQHVLFHPQHGTADALCLDQTNHYLMNSRHKQLLCVFSQKPKLFTGSKYPAKQSVLFLAEESWRT